VSRRRKEETSVDDLFDESLEEIPEEEELQTEEDLLLVEGDWSYSGEEPRLPKLSPELRLRLAILGDAILCLQKKPHTGSYVRLTKKQREESMDFDHADQWFKGEIESAPTCSFEDVCEVLGLDPSATRKACYRIAGSGQFDIRELVFWLR
jgi:hypothetical protein